MDLVVTYKNQRYVIELKIWYGEKRLQDGIEQLCSYLDSYGLNEGHILIFNFNSNKTYDIREINHHGKHLTAFFV
jgi:phage-related protein